jgi:LuxR family maltose regulon positive regulatory protein
VPRAALRGQHRTACSIRRIEQAGAFYLQARGWLVVYAADMSIVDEAIALFADQDVGQAADTSVVLCGAMAGNRVRPAQGTWQVRRSIVRARSALTNMRLDEAARATAQLKRLLSNRSDAYGARYACALEVLEASMLAAVDDLPAARRKLMGIAAHTRDTLAATVLRFVDWIDGEREPLCVPDTVDYLAAPVGGNAASRILSLCVSAALAFDRLQLAVSANLAGEALQLARSRYGNHSPINTFPATLLAQVAYQQGRLEEAEALLRPRLSVIRASGVLECVARASVLLARLSLHRGRHRAALVLLRETEALGRARGWPRLARIACSEHARALEMLRYIDGHVSDASTPRGNVVPLERSRCASVVALHAALPGASPRAQPSRAGLDALSQDEALSFSAIEAATQRACSAAAHGAFDEGYRVLIPWLRIGAARGLHMAFVDAGRPLRGLLERLYHGLPTHDPRLSDLRPYIATLLRSAAQPDTQESPSITYRPLSRRETGILQLIAHGMSNKRIAQSLGITPETVKSHAKSIFVKLATRTRAQAVARAEAIGFL